MKAGNTSFEVGTKIKIIDSYEEDLIGLTGTITHPFPGLMWSGVKYTIGVRLDQKGIYEGDICNLATSDKFIIL